MNDLKWRYRLEKKAQKQLGKLSPKDRAGVFASIVELAQTDNPPLVKGVKHHEGTSNPKEWRQRWDAGAFSSPFIQARWWKWTLSTKANSLSTPSASTTQVICAKSFYRAPFGALFLITQSL